MVFQLPSSGKDTDSFRAFLLGIGRERWSLRRANPEKFTVAYLHLAASYRFGRKQRTAKIARYGKKFR
jgi:hypothetical protein